MTTETRSITSIGKLAADERTTYRRLERAVALAGVTPTIVINGVAHFDDSSLDLIRAKLREPETRTGEPTR